MLGVSMKHGVGCNDGANKIIKSIQYFAESDSTRVLVVLDFKQVSRTSHKVPCSQSLIDTAQTQLLSSRVVTLAQPPTVCTLTTQTFAHTRHKRPHYCSVSLSSSGRIGVGSPVQLHAAPPWSAWQSVINRATLARHWNTPDLLLKALSVALRTNSTQRSYVNAIPKRIHKQLT